MPHENPTALTERVDHRLRIESGAEGVFLTAFICYLNPLAHTVDYVIAGHEAPLLCQSGQESALPGSGGVLGLLDSFTGSTERIELAPEFTVLVYTDGIADAPNSRDGDVEPIDDVTLLMISREASADLQSHEQQNHSGKQQCPNE